MAPPLLTAAQLNRATLSRQGLLDPLPEIGVAAAVARIGSLQAQHPDWPAFALQARRASGAKYADLAQARRRKQVVRASLMRMTVHVVAADDFWPMSTLTLPFRRTQWRIMYKQDPQSSALGRRIAATHESVVAALREQPRAIHEIEAIMASQLGAEEVPPNRGLWRHFSGAVPLVHAPIDGEVYGRQRYLAAADWLGPPTEAASDPALAAAHVARRYLAAFGPASVEDLVAYVGRSGPVGPWRRAIDALGDEVVRFVDEDGRELFDLADAPRPPATVPAPPRLLARWDSLLLAYGTRHRTRLLPEAHRSTVITRNADVLPTFLVDGVVAGTWLPRRGKDGAARVELRPFARLRRATREALAAEADRLLPVLAAGAFARYPGTD